MTALYLDAQIQFQYFNVGFFQIGSKYKNIQVKWENNKYFKYDKFLHNII